MSAIAKQQKAKGDTFMAEAKKTLAARSWFSSKDAKYEGAAEAMTNAGNAYKVGGFYHEAGDAYKQAAEMYRDHLKNSFEASKALQNAGKGG